MAIWIVEESQGLLQLNAPPTTVAFEPGNNVAVIFGKLLPLHELNLPVIPIFETVINCEKL
jgi:hypothetical protein